MTAAMQPREMPAIDTLTVPATAHFVWLGTRLPALGWLSVRSALDRGGFATAVLHYEHAALPADPLVADLARRGVRLQRLGGPQIADAGLQPGTRQRLDALERSLDLPASRANLMRLDILWREGGVYLDTDAIVLRDMRQLRLAQGFAGLERVCLPGALADSRSPLRWARAGALLALREGLTHLRDTGSAFARVETWYDLACNNAIVGARPRHPLVGRMLELAVAMPPARARRRYQLGPRLLEEATANRSAPDFQLQPPVAFYPLAPEVCADYIRDDPQARLHPDARTYVAHLYDSVLARRLGRPIDATWLRQARGRTLLTRLVEPYLDALLAIG